MMGFLVVRVRQGLSNCVLGRSVCAIRVWRSQKAEFTESEPTRNDAPPHPLTRQEALEWVYAADAPASLEATERRRNYLEFVYQYSQRNLRKGA